MQVVMISVFRVKSERLPQTILPPRDLHPAGHLCGKVCAVHHDACSRPEGHQKSSVEDPEYCWCDGTTDDGT